MNKIQKIVVGVMAVSVLTWGTYSSIQNDERLAKHAAAVKAEKAEYEKNLASLTKKEQKLFIKYQRAGFRTVGKQTRKCAAEGGSNCVGQTLLGLRYSNMEFVKELIQNRKANGN